MKNFILLLITGFCLYSCVHCVQTQVPVSVLKSSFYDFQVKGTCSSASVFSYTLLSGEESSVTIKNVGKHNELDLFDVAINGQIFTRMASGGVDTCHVSYIFDDYGRGKLEFKRGDDKKSIELSSPITNLTVSAECSVFDEVVKKEITPTVTPLIRPTTAQTVENPLKGNLDAIALVVSFLITFLVGRFKNSPVINWIGSTSQRITFVASILSLFVLCVIAGFSSDSIALLLESLKTFDWTNIFTNVLGGTLGAQVTYDKVLKEKE